MWRDSDNSSDLHQEYKSVKLEFEALIESTKTDYYNSAINDCSDSKSVQKVVDELLYRKINITLPTSNCDVELATRFSTFFRDKTEEIRANLPQIDEEMHVDLPPAASTLGSFSSVSVDEVRKLITLSKCKSCSLDPIPTWLLKKSLDDILPAIVHIINLSLSNGSVPHSMKCAIVSPLLKKPTLDKEILKKYRPVSNLTFLSNVLERVVARQLIDYMSRHHLHEVYQSAYKQFHSTETALLKIQNDILCGIDSGDAVILIQLYLSAAFDLMDHKILLKRMEDILGIKDTALEWFASYLSGHSQKVKIGKEFSLAEFLTYRVPQGSVLGPLLFLVYILPLAVIFRKHGLCVHGFADDTQSYVRVSPKSPSSINETVARVELCLRDVYKWMSQNMLKLNSDKTEIIILGTNATRAKIDVTQICVGNCTVRIEGKPVTNLGVTFDPGLTLKEQVNHVVKSCNYYLRNIMRIRKFLTPEATIRTIVTLVLSRLDYCNALLSGLPKKLIKKLQLVQNYTLLPG